MSILTITTATANAIQRDKGRNFGNVDIITAAMEAIETSGIRTRKADREALEIELTLYSNRLCDGAHARTRYDGEHELKLADFSRRRALEVARRMDARVTS